MAALFTVKQRVADLVRQHGSYNAASLVVGVSRARLWEIAKGRRGAGDVTLRALGLDPETAVYGLLTAPRNGSSL